MKHAVACRRGITVLLGLGLCLCVGWGAVLEDGSGSTGSYTNLAPQSGGDPVGWASPPSGRYLAQSSNQRAAQAVYPIRDATMVRVSVYSRLGSFASFMDDRYVRGNGGSGEYRLGYSTRDGQVYLDGARMLYDPDDPYFYWFQPEEEVPSGLVDYGLNVYWSADGEEYIRTGTQMTGCEAEDGAHYYETYEADIDPSARFLKLVLYDQSSLEVLGRAEPYEYTSAGDLAIASVESDGRLSVKSSSSQSDGDGYEEEDFFQEEVPFREEIIETAPNSAAVTPAFPDEFLPEQQTPKAAGPASSKAAGDSGKAAGKTAGKTGGTGKVQLQGENQYREEASAQPVGEIIRPVSLAGGEESLLDRLGTPEGLSVFFFALVCLLLALKIFVKA